MTTIEDWKQQPGVLTSVERAELARLLLSSLVSDEQEIEAAWDAEATRMVEEIRGGSADVRPVSELLAKLYP